MVPVPVPVPAGPGPLCSSLAKHDKCEEVNVVYAVLLKNEVGALGRATMVAR